MDEVKVTQRFAFRIDPHSLSRAPYDQPEHALRCTRCSIIHQRESSPVTRPNRVVDKTNRALPDQIPRLAVVYGEARVVVPEPLQTVAVGAGAFGLVGFGSVVNNDPRRVARWRSAVGAGAFG